MPRTRRSFDADFKAQTVLQVLRGAASQAELCRKHNINGQLLGHWKTIALEGLPSLFDKEGQTAPRFTPREPLPRPIPARTRARRTALSPAARAGDQG